MVRAFGPNFMLRGNSGTSDEFPETLLARTHTKQLRTKKPTCCEDGRAACEPAITFGKLDAADVQPLANVNEALQTYVCMCTGDAHARTDARGPQDDFQPS